MPEIGEVARVVHFIRQHLVGKTVASVTAKHDENVFGKVGTSAAEFEKAMKGKKIVGAGQQGKYFWITMSSPPHPVLHLGMSGWFDIKGVSTKLWKHLEKDEWPPKYWKFLLETKPEGDALKVEAAFVDSRRFGRIRLVDCPGDDIRSYSPLKENGPDPVIDKDIVTVAWLKEKCRSKKIPIKALLLDQANISGIGNWVGDELLYDAKIHPEQYSNTLSDAQIKQLHKSIHYVCSFACEVLSESSKFPEHWLFKHRWGKGKKDSPNRLPNGEKITFMTVGGRTSAVIPSVQKKTGPVAGDIDGDDVSDGQEEEEPKVDKKQANTKRKRDPKEGKKTEDKDSKDERDDIKPKRSKATKAEAKTKPAANKAKTEAKNKSKIKGEAKPTVKKETNEETTSRRRSTRLSRG